MDEFLGTDARVRMLVVAALDGRLSDRQAEELAAVDEKLLKLVLLAAARRIAELRGKIGRAHV